MRRNNPAAVYLEMHQAGRGDLLRFVNGDRSVIIDSGPPYCAEKLRKLLNERRCETLVITHLDDDHYGGLHALLQKYWPLRGDEVEWPKKVIVNDFEPNDAVGAIWALKGGDNGEGDANDRQIVDSAIAAGNEWRRSGGFIVSEEWEEGGRDPFGASVVLEVDERAFEYIVAAENAKIDFVRLHRRAFPDEEAHRLFHELIARLYESTPRQTLAFDDVILRVSNSGNMRFNTRDRALRDQLRRGEIPPGLPPSVRGLLHLKLHGTPLLESVRSASDAVTFLGALRRMGIPLEVARVGDPPIAAFDNELRLHILGPDAQELRRLAASWSEIQGKLPTIHLRAQRLAFVEATFVAADIGRYSPDPSITNRSSIQLLGETDRASAVLTGDGIPETLERTLRTSGLPARECRVFKAAHHGSSRNIDLRQQPNRLLSIFKPNEIWVSGRGKHHPAHDFLTYLCAQPDSSRTQVLVTNPNRNVSAMNRHLRIGLMKGDQPFVCAL